ncbi:unannotated protein [freshwater metagenome]|uniref:Unannotated protein n=1 Tax=freshwater metagenome TaxID=449393 RepID=A0A6J7HTF6_9ZZZZ
MAEGDGEVDAGIGDQRRIDLAELDSESAHLDLKVGASDELQLQIARPPHHVSGAVHPAAVDSVRIGDEPLGGQTRLAEVPTRKRATRQVEVTCDSGRYRLETRVENQCGHAVDRPADGDGLVRRQLCEAGDDRRLRRTVSVEVLATRCPPREQFGGGHVSTDREHLERIDPVRIHRAQNCRGDDGMGDLLGLQQIGQLGAAQNGGRHDDQRRPYGERSHPFQHRGVEIGRTYVQETSGCRQVIQVGCGVENSAQTGMRDDDALRLTGGAGGVDDVSRVLDCDRTQSIRVRHGVRGPRPHVGNHPVVVEVEPEQIRMPGGHGGRVLRRGQTEDSIRVRDHVTDPVRWIGRVDGQVCRSRFGHRPHREHHLVRTSEPERHN